MSIPDWAKEILERLTKLEVSVKSMDKRMKAMEERLGTINGRLWDEAKSSAKAKAQLAVVVMLVAAATSAVFSLLIRLMTR